MVRILEEVAVIYLAAKQCSNVLVLGLIDGCGNNSEDPDEPKGDKEEHHHRCS